MCRCMDVTSGEMQMLLRMLTLPISHILLTINICTSAPVTSAYYIHRWHPHVTACHIPISVDLHICILPVAMQNNYTHNFVFFRCMSLKLYHVASSRWPINTECRLVQFNIRMSTIIGQWCWLSASWCYGWTLCAKSDFWPSTCSMPST